jgi:hypothetical protein
MPGASEQAQRVKILNANWVPGTGGGDGRFEIMIVTADDERHTLPASAASITAVVALAQAGTVMVWDPPKLSGSACRAARWRPTAAFSCPCCCGRGWSG